jgi:hypothetical protein
MKNKKGSKKGGVHIPLEKSSFRQRESVSPAPKPIEPRRSPRNLGASSTPVKVRAWYFTCYLYGMIALEFLTFLAVQATPIQGVELLHIVAVIITFLDIFALVHLFLWKKWAVWLHIGVLSVSAVITLLIGEFGNAGWLALHILVFVSVLNVGKRSIRQWPKFE